MTSSRVCCPADVEAMAGLGQGRGVSRRPLASAEDSDVACVPLGRADLPAGYRSAIDTWVAQRTR
jgi:hypothetical protein